MEVPYLQLRETHCAGLLLVGDQVFKFKKPVDLGFLDFTTRSARAEACRREVLLNRRFAPDVYLGVADVLLPGGETEPLVVMRRMPDERRLSHLVDLGVDVADDLRALARLVAVVHADGTRRPEIDEQASRARLRGRWDESFAQVRETAAGADREADVGEVERLAVRFLDGRAPLFEQRLADGCAVDGHGDLISDDVFCLADGPRALDCLEFDDALRYVDRVDDASFLAMDLEQRGAPELGAAFLQWYAEFSGDDAPPSLVHHYVAYRAFVRAKVACVRHEQGADTAEEIDSHLWVAERHLAEGAVTLVLVGGPPGSGKTTVAGAVADRTGMVLLTADRLRKELAGLDPSKPAAAPYEHGIYSPRHTLRTYGELVRRAEALLARGESVVLDASWTRAGDRELARTAARRTHSDLVELLCSAPEAETTARVAARTRAQRARGGAVSDADAAVAAALRDKAEPWPEATVVDTSAEASAGGAPGADAAVDAAVARVRPSPETHHLRRPRRRPFLEPD